ncbi:S-layer homology domain-containing protein [Aneurinibacillus sp. BA2021]|nr:S-layer homology domain-containing protein [Aneurinibacillus sp. BA2021]
MRKRKSSLKGMTWLALFCMVLTLASPVQLMLYPKSASAATTPRSENFDNVPTGPGVKSQQINDWTFSMASATGGNPRVQVRFLAPNTTNNLLFLGTFEAAANEYGRVQSNTGAFKLLSFRVLERNNPADHYRVVGYLGGQQVAGAEKSFDPVYGQFSPKVDVSNDSEWNNIDEFRIFANKTIKLDIDDIMVTDPVVASQPVDATAPNIDTQPIDQTVNVGGNASLSVGVSGGASLSYQWYSNTTNSNSGGTLISGATSATYAPTTDTAGTTYYYVVVTNTDTGATGQKTATATSAVAKVQVKALTHAAVPSIYTQPADQTVYTGNNAPLHVMANVSVGGALSYQWYSNRVNSNTDGTPINGATNASYDAPTTTVGVTYYYVVVTNTDGSATGQKTATTTSRAAAVTVHPTPPTHVPIITLNGDNPIYLLQGETYNEPGYSAFDEVDGDLTDKVIVTGDTIQIGTIGTYELRYNVKNFSGNNALEAKRTVQVVSNKLASLSVQSGTVTPAFEPNNQVYTVDVPTEVNSVTITAHAADPTATVTIDGEAKGNGGSKTVDVQADGTFIAIVVTAQDGTTKKTYTITVTRATPPPSTNANLSNLTVSEGALDPMFASGTADYTVNVESGVSSIDVTPIVADAGATVTVNGNAVTFGNATNIPLSVGSNPITVIVTAANGTTTQTYTVTVTRAAPTNAAAPNIDTQPTDQTVNVGDGATLSVGASGGVSLSYQWYSSTTNSNSGGTLISGATGATYAPPTDTAGTTYYYVVVTNTDTGATGQQTATATSAVAKVQVNATPSEPQPEIITVPVEPGGTGNGSTDPVASVPIKRTPLPDGTKKDEVSYSKEKAQETVNKLKEIGVNTARIVIPDPQDLVAEINVSLKKESISTLEQGSVNLAIETDNARIVLPASSMKNIEDDVYFRVVPIKKEEQKQQIENQVKVEEAVRKIAGDRGVSIVGRPMTIETNLPSRPVDLVLPLRDLSLPNDEAERAAFLNRLGVFIQHSDGEKVFVKGEVVPYKGSQLGLKFMITKFSTFTIVKMDKNVQPGGNSGGSSGGGRESDHSPAPPVSNPTTQVPEKLEVQHNKYMNGYPDGTFRPDQPITRAEIAAILAAMTKPEDVNTENRKGSTIYKDVFSAHWAAEPIRLLSNLHIVQGYTDGTFKPNQPITRAEMASLLVRWQKIKVEAVPINHVKDIQDHWAKDDIAALYKRKWMHGYPDGTFKPNQHMTRAETVTVINQILHRGPLQEKSLSTWKDVPADHWAFQQIEEASCSHTSIIDSNGKEIFVP